LNADDAAKQSRIVHVHQVEPNPQWILYVKKEISVERPLGRNDLINLEIKNQWFGDGEGNPAKSPDILVGVEIVELNQIEAGMGLQIAQAWKFPADGRIKTLLRTGLKPVIRKITVSAVIPGDRQRERGGGLVQKLEFEEKFGGLYLDSPVADHIGTVG